MIIPDNTPRQDFYVPFTNKEEYEQNGYKRAIADVQKILDEISDDCCITIGHMTYGGGKDELKRRVSALLEVKS